MSDTTPTESNLAFPPLAPHQERVWGILIPIGGIFLHFLPALFGFVLLKDRGPLIREQTRRALNFQLTVLAAYVLSFFTLWLLVGFLFLAVVAVLNVIFCLLAAIAADKGEVYDYRLSLPFIRA